jgi:hypothetical protein
MTFLQFWAALNAALAARGEPEALHSEAHDWYGSRPVVGVDERMVNRVINDRKPIDWSAMGVK